MNTIIHTDDLYKEYPNAPRAFATALIERLSAHVGKKVVLVFREPVKGRRHIRRHHCVIHGLCQTAAMFSPPIPIPRAMYTDLLMTATSLLNIKQVEVK